MQDRELSYLTDTVLPNIFQYGALVVLLFLSGIFSGLTLGLMSLDETFLSVLIRSKLYVANEVLQILTNIEQEDKNPDDFTILEISYEKIENWLSNLEKNFRYEKIDEINKISTKILTIKESSKKNVNNFNHFTKIEEINNELRNFYNTYYMGIYAEAILPVRKCGNFLLVCLLIGNTTVNTAISIFMSDITGGLVGLISSTITIVILGEIIPQALCNKHSLYIGSVVTTPMKLLMKLFYLVAYPISILVDWMVGEDIKENLSRNYMQALIKKNKEYLEDDEKKIIEGVLELKNTISGSVMTKLDDGYLLNGDRKIDLDVVSEIYKEGYSRIPVYKYYRSNIVGIFYVKDLLLLDSKKDYTILEYMDHSTKRNLIECLESDTLYDILSQMKKNYSHIAMIKPKISEEIITIQQMQNPVIKRSKNNSEYDESEYASEQNLKNYIGLITMEDIIEKIIGEEIFDEKDDKIKNYNFFKMFQISDHNEKFMQREELMLTTYLHDNKKYFGDFDLKDLQEFVSKCEVVNIGVGNPDTFLELRKEHKNRNNSKFYTLDPKSMIFPKNKKVDSAYIVIYGEAMVYVGNDEIERSYQKFELINERLLERLYEAYTCSLELTEFKSSYDIINSNKPDYYAKGAHKSCLLRIRLKDYFKMLSDKLSKKKQEEIMDKIDISSSDSSDRNMSSSESIRSDGNAEGKTYVEFDEDEEFKEKMNDMKMSKNRIRPNLKMIDYENKLKSQCRTRF